MARFDGRPRFAELGAMLQGDIKGLARSYARACRAADELLLSIGSAELIDAACRDSAVGKLTPSALYVHEWAVGALPVPLRLFEGCARGYLGRVEGANVVKLSRAEPKVSYLSYPDFETDPHPALAEALTVNLRTFGLRVRRYTQYRNPPILHRKEAFLAADHPLRAKFARLTRLEEAKGLYADTSRIGTRDGWAAMLAAKGLTLRRHRPEHSHADRILRQAAVLCAGAYRPAVCMRRVLTQVDDAPRRSSHWRPWAFLVFGQPESALVRR